MTVKPRDVMHSVSSEEFVPVNDILKNFVVHVAYMRFRVRKCRTIVNHPSRVDRRIVSIKLRGNTIWTSGEVLPIVKLLS